MFIEGFEDGGIDVVHHAEIVGVNDEKAGVGGVAKAFGDGFGGRRS